MKIKFLKTHEDAVLPSAARTKKKVGDTGLDLVAVTDTLLPAKGSAVVPVGLTVADITPGYWFRIEARSGLGFKHGIFPHFGVIDNQYRGDLGVKLYNNTNDDYFVTKGDKIAQIVVYKLIQPNVSFAKEVKETDRGADGFGSTGK